MRPGPAYKPPKGPDQWSRGQQVHGGLFLLHVLAGAPGGTNCGWLRLAGGILQLADEHKAVTKREGQCRRLLGRPNLPSGPGGVAFDRLYGLCCPLPLLQKLKHGLPLKHKR